MNTIALFGATGQTGQQFLPKALEAGYAVRALVRTPDKLSLKDPQLTVVQGDVLDQTSVDKTISGADVVVSLFGHVKGSPRWLQTNGTRHIIAAMGREGISRIISLSGGGLPFPEKDLPRFPDKLIRLIMRIAVPHILEDAAGHHEVLKESGLDWTIVRGPRLTNDPPTGTYRVGWVGVNASTRISRGDLADFLLSQISDRSFLHQMPFVSD